MDWNSTNRTQVFSSYKYQEATNDREEDTDKTDFDLATVTSDKGN